jgi:hypothetical protein
MPLPMAKTMQNFGTSRNTSGSETSPHTNSMMKKHNKLVIDLIYEISRE